MKQNNRQYNELARCLLKGKPTLRAFYWCDLAKHTSFRALKETPAGVIKGCVLIQAADSVQALEKAAYFYTANWEQRS